MGREAAMSLDVYLILPDAPSVRPEGILIRRDGATVEISREEWDELCPDREPSVLTSQLYEETEVYWANITHNLTNMAKEAGLYDVLWRPDEHGIERAEQLVEPLREGFLRLASGRDHFERFSPPNGWGDYHGLLRFTAAYLDACEQWPDAKVRVSR